MCAKTVLGCKKAVVELNLPPLKAKTSAEDDNDNLNHLLFKSKHTNKSVGARILKSLELASNAWKESWKV